LPWGRCTTKISGNTTTLYLHVFDWPAGGELLVPGLKNKIKSAWLLADPKKKQLAAINGDDGVAISVPPAAPDKISSTIVLRFKGAPDIGPKS
jgi:alpha-L-fucosidase